MYYIERVVSMSEFASQKNMVFWHDIKHPSLCTLCGPAVEEQHVCVGFLKLYNRRRMEGSGTKCSADYCPHMADF